MVRAERLQEITEEDAIAEGIEIVWEQSQYKGVPGLANPRELYAWVWDSLNAKRGYGWDKNNWVWPIRFQIIKQ